MGFFFETCHLELRRAKRMILMNHCSTGFIINCDCARQSELFQMKYEMKMAAVRPQFFKRLPCLIEASFFCSNLNRGNHKLQAIAKHMVMQHLSAFNRAIYWLQCSCHRASNAFSEVMCIYSFKYCVQCCIFTIAYKIVQPLVNTLVPQAEG